MSSHLVNRLRTSTSRSSWSLKLIVVVLLAVSGCADSDNGVDEHTGSLPVVSTSTTARTATTPIPTTAIPATTAASSTTSTQPTDSSTTDSPATDSPTTVASPARVPVECSQVSAGYDTLEIEAAGNSYIVDVYVPSRFEPGTPTPIVLNWHGLGSNGLEQSLLTAYDLLANEEGFIVVYPTGLSDPGVGRPSWELDQFDVTGRDDLAFANRLIDVMIADYCGDSERIYSTGMSNGGFFTSRLVCELSDRLAAAASVAGVSHFDGCRPSRAIPFIAFHGTADDVVPFAGGSSTLQGEAAGMDSTFFDQNMADEFAEFARDAGCAVDPKIVSISDSVLEYQYQGCDDAVQMSFYEIDGGGHTWPGSPFGSLLEVLMGPTTQDIAATDLGWELFRENTLSGQ